MTSRHSLTCISVNNAHLVANVCSITQQDVCNGRCFSKAMALTPRNPYVYMVSCYDVLVLCCACACKNTELPKRTKMQDALANQGGVQRLCHLVTIDIEHFCDCWCITPGWDNVRASASMCVPPTCVQLPRPHCSSETPVVCNTVRLRSVASSEWLIFRSFVCLSVQCWAMLEADSGEPDKAHELFTKGSTLCPRWVAAPQLLRKEMTRLPLSVLKHCLFETIKLAVGIAVMVCMHVSQTSWT